MGQANPVSVVLDAGALIAFERGNAKMRALLRNALRVRARILIPAGVLGQVWRAPGRQVPLRALVDADMTELVLLTRVLAEASGVLCGKTGTSDVIDASVALTARLERAVVVTSDATDLKRLDPALRLEQV